jgi:hypothetical protein
MFLRTALAMTVALAPLTVTAECYLDSHTRTQGTTVLDSVSVLRQELTRNQFAWQTCSVTVEGRLGEKTFQGLGASSWQDASPPEEHCARARNRAIENVREQAGRLQVDSSQSLECSDRPENTAIDRRPITVASHLAVGYRAPLHEFQVYNRSRPFSHGRFPGSQCLQFMNHMRKIGGVICRTTDPNVWQVVDVNINGRLQ